MGRRPLADFLVSEKTDRFMDSGYDNDAYSLSHPRLSSEMVGGAGAVAAGHKLK
jgi:hypothetical protein